MSKGFPSDIVSKYVHVERISVGKALQSTVCSPNLLEAPYWAIAEDSRAGFEQKAMEAYEWLSLVKLESPRTLSNDTVDTFLSRYATVTNNMSQVHVCKISWEGLISNRWFCALVRDVFAACPADCWVSMSAADLSNVRTKANTEVTILKPVGTQTEYLTWEIKRSV